MIKIVHGVLGEEILTRAEKVTDCVKKVKEFRIGEFEEDIRESRALMLEVKEQMDLGGATDNLIYEYKELEEAIGESEDLIAEIEKCKSITTLNSLEIYGELWEVKKIP